MQVLRVCRFSTFSLPPAFPPCCCPLAFRRQVRRLTSRMSSESYPGYPECVVSCHGAGRFANSITPLFGQFLTVGQPPRVAYEGVLSMACGPAVEERGSAWVLTRRSWPSTSSIHPILSG